MKTFDFNEVKEYISNQSPETKIYIGCDSERILVNKIWYADYTLAIVVHIDGKHGCKLFGEIQRERDFEQNKNRPRLRLMNEVYKVSELYLKLADVLDDRQVEVHLDLSPNEMNGSNCVINQAIGYIRGTCNVVPMIKPQAFAASYAADRMKYVMNN